MRVSSVANVCLSFAAVLISGAHLRGAQPLINRVFPPALQLGAKQSIQFEGKQLSASASLLLPFQAMVKRTNANGDTASFDIRVSKQTMPGVYPVRVRTDAGISNLRLLVVTTVPVVSVREPNGRYQGGRPDLSSAQAVQWPVAIAGHRLSQDIDLFRFRVRRGQRLVFVTETRRVGLTPDPILMLRDAQGRLLRYAHDTPGLRRDERIDYTFRRAGDYYLEVRSVGVAGWNNCYLVKIGDFHYSRSVFPLGGRRGALVRFSLTGSRGKSIVTRRAPVTRWVDRWRLPFGNDLASLPRRMAVGDLPEVDEQSKRGDPQLVSWPVTVNGRILKGEDSDLYRIKVRPGQQLCISVAAWYLDSDLDASLLIYDHRRRKLVAHNEDQSYRGNPDPKVAFVVPKNTTELTVEVRSTLGSSGDNHGYRLTIDRGPDFDLVIGRRQNPYKDEGWAKMDMSDTLVLDRQRKVPLLISAPRGKGGYQGPIDVKALGLPKGVTIRPATIGKRQASIKLLCEASEEAPQQPFTFVVVGEVRTADGVVRRFAERKLFISDPQMTHMAWDWRVKRVTAVIAR